MALFNELEEMERRLRIQDSLELPDEEPLLLNEIQDKESEEPAVTVPPDKKRRSLLKRGQRLEHRKPLFKRQKLFDIEEVAPESEIPMIVSPHSTFMLRLDDEGNLCGFDRPKLKPEPLRVSFHRRKKEAEGGEAPTSSGRFGKLRSLFSRKKGSSEAGSSKLSKVLGKFKGLGRRRSKE